MQGKARFYPAPVDRLFSHESKTHLLVIGALFVVALGLRAYHIGQPPLSFHPIRQYRSAIIARGYYLGTLPSVPDWQREVAMAAKAKEGILEPPIMELLACSAYRIAGGEQLWIPKMLSALFWLGGGLFLYALAKSLMSGAAAVASTAFYLLLPFGVSASRSFQPDSLMVLCFLASVFTISRYQVQPSKSRLAVATALSALAIFVKPVCLFPIFSAFVMADVSRQGVRKTMVSLGLILFCGVSILPAALFYSYVMFGAGFLKGQAEMSFIPSLYMSLDFWLGWLDQINSVVGYATLVVALLGVLLIREGLPRAVLSGLWIGYLVFGMTFTYHIHTHDYYQLQLVPIVALSVAPICVLVSDGLARACSQRRWRTAVLGIALLASILYVREVRWRLRTEDSRQLTIAQEIGTITKHSTETVFLAGAYGKPLEYHGEISGEPWPRRGDFRLDRLQGKQVLTASERLDSLIKRFSPEYFIVADFREYESQPDLKQCLAGAFPVAEQSSDYVIFRLRPGNRAGQPR